MIIYTDKVDPGNIQTPEELDEFLKIGGDVEMRIYSSAKFGFPLKIQRTGNWFDFLEQNTGNVVMVNKFISIEDGILFSKKNTGYPCVIELNDGYQYNSLISILNSKIYPKGWGETSSGLTIAGLVKILS